MQEAVGLHRRGALADAAARCTEIMRRESKNVDAVSFLALIMTQQRQFQEATRLLRKSCQARAPARRRPQSAGRDVTGDRPS
jgi:thioredoxin-like negative regulator of GroEL